MKQRQGAQHHIVARHRRTTARMPGNLREVRQRIRMREQSGLRCTCRAAGEQRETRIVGRAVNYIGFLISISRYEDPGMGEGRQ